MTFLREAKATLAEGGLIGLKDNILVGSESEFDDKDHSVCRSEAHLQRIFKEAGLKVIKRAVQKGFPKNLYPVIMFMLKPDTP